MTSPKASYRIATCASQLALWQANYVAQLIREGNSNRGVELVEISTQGDRDQSEPLAQFGGQGVFTREVQKAVLDGRADIAVHSLKDLPTQLTAGLTLAGIPQRGPRFDVLVFPKKGQSPVSTWDDLPQGARIGTGSLRRQAQLLHRRHDLLMKAIRGNVETRLRKLDEGDYAAIVLAQAGLERLGLGADRCLCPLLPPLMLPAVGQAALGLECRSDDESTIACLAALTDSVTSAEVTAERACLHELHAGCHAPVGLVAEVTGNVLRLQGVVLSADGQTRIVAEVSGDLAKPEVTGQSLAAALLKQGAGDLITSS